MRSLMKGYLETRRQGALNQDLSGYDNSHADINDGQDENSLLLPFGGVNECRARGLSVTSKTNAYQFRSMTRTELNRSTGLAAWLRQSLNRPLSSFWCVMSWFGATAVFVGLSGLLGGPTESDAAESVYSTWSIAHGNLTCVYPPTGNHHFSSITNPFALVAPLYPLISGGAAALLRIGHDVAFPSQHELGPQCVNAFDGMLDWSATSSAILPTVRLGYLVWPVLVAGIIALLRVSGRGRRGWESLTLFLVAGTPPVLNCLTLYFHPQDLLAMGLILGGVACSVKKRWLWVGVLLGLAFCSQQFALLVIAPLIVIAPTQGRIRLGIGAILAVALIDVPLIVATSGRAVKTILLGSSRVGLDIKSKGGTVLWEANLHGTLLFEISRVVPVAASMAFAWWVSRRLGTRVLSSIPLISLIATSLTLRLIFEENLFGYYFMAVAVALLVLDVAVGRIRGPLLAWIALVTATFNPVHLGFSSNLTSWTVPLYHAIPIVLLGAMVISAAFDAAVRRVHLYKVMWIIVVALTCESTLWGLSHSIVHVPNWLWQVVLVPTALVLAVTPLLKVPTLLTDAEPISINEAEPRRLLT